ncbi:MAG: ABC transporter permease [Rhizobiaceae bacterium]
MTDAVVSPRTAAPARSSVETTMLLAPLSFAIFLALWEIAVRVLDVPAYLVPTPSAVAVKAWSDLTSGLIVRHFGVTLFEVLAGFAIAAVGGVLVGTAIGLMPLLNRTIYPLILAFQTIPKIALAPLFLIWFGFGPTSKIVTVATIVFFPVLVNVIAGLSTVDARRLVLMRALGAGPLKAYVKVRFPSMLPYLFAGLEVAIVFSVTGAIVAEFIGASQGLGSLIIQRQSNSDVAGVFSVLVYLTIMGLVLHAVLRAIGRHFTAWAQTERVLNS